MSRQLLQIGGMAGWLLVAMLHGAAAGEAPVLSLDECLRLALEDHPRARAATYRLESARAAARQARSAYYPQLGANASWTLTDNPPQAFMMTLNQRRFDDTTDFNDPDDTENIRLGLGARWALYDGGRRRLGAAAADGMARAGEAGALAIRHALAHQVTQSFYAVLQADAWWSIQSEWLRSLQTSHRLVSERVEAGAALQSDRLNVQVLMAEAEEATFRAGNAVALAMAALNAALGRDLVTSPAQLPERDDLPEPPEVPPGPEAMRQRPEWRASQADMQRAHALWQRARRDHRPTLSAFGALDWDRDPSSDFESSYLAGVMAEMELFTGGRRRAAAAGALADWRAAEAAAAELERRLILEIKSAQLSVSNAWGRMAVVRTALTAAQEALRLTRAQYAEGAADVGALIAAETATAASRLRATTARYDYRMALSDLARAKGDALAEVGSVANATETRDLDRADAAGEE